MTFTLDLPEDVALRLTELLPSEERSRFAVAAIADALNARLRQADARLADALEAEYDPECDDAECRAIVEQELADVEAGRGKSVSLEEARRQWEAEKAARQVARRAGSSPTYEASGSAL